MVAFDVGKQLGNRGTPLARSRVYNRLVDALPPPSRPTGAAESTLGVSRAVCTGTKAV